MFTITLVALAALLILIFALEAAFNRSRRRSPARRAGVEGTTDHLTVGDGSAPAETALPTHGHAHHTAPDAGGHHGGYSDGGGFLGHGGFGGGFDGGGGGHGH